MTPYRTASKPETPTLDIRPEPIGGNVLILVFSPLLWVSGLAMLTDVVVHDRDSFASRLGSFGMAAAFLLGGAGASFVAWRGLATKVRFRLEGDLVRIEWLRGGTVHRSEQVRREHVVDVGLEASPSSGAAIYRIVIGTREGDIALTAARGNLRGYGMRAEKIAAFLGVRMRPT